MTSSTHFSPVTGHATTWKHGESNNVGGLQSPFSNGRGNYKKNCSSSRWGVGSDWESNPVNVRLHPEFMTVSGSLGTSQGTSVRALNQETLQTCTSEWWDSSKRSWPRHYAGLYSGTNAQEVCTLWRWQKSLALPGLELRFLGRSHYAVFHLMTPPLGLYCMDINGTWLVQGIEEVVVTLKNSDQSRLKRIQ